MEIYRRRLDLSASRCTLQIVSITLHHRAGHSTDRAVAEVLSRPRICNDSLDRAVQPILLVCKRSRVAVHIEFRKVPISPESVRDDNSHHSRTFPEVSRIASRILHVSLLTSPFPLGLGRLSPFSLPRTSRFGLGYSVTFTGTAHALAMQHRRSSEMSYHGLRRRDRSPIRPWRLC